MAYAEAERSSKKLKRKQGETDVEDELKASKKQKKGRGRKEAASSQGDELEHSARPNGSLETAKTSKTPKSTPRSTATDGEASENTEKERKRAKRKLKDEEGRVEKRQRDHDKPREKKRNKKSEKSKRDTKVRDATEAAPAAGQLPAKVTNLEVQPSSVQTPVNTDQALEQSVAEEGDADETPTSASKTRFIVFVGNLPYTATSAALKSHFSSLKPASIRHLTQKDDPSKSKGFAFLEFDHYDRMRTCLKLYHHSMFDDGSDKPRRINVELTAGGGGTGKDRKEKLKAKNQKLGEQRKRKKENEDAEGSKPKAAKETKQAVAEKKVEIIAEKAEKIDDGIGDVHPSRRGMIGNRR